MSFSFNYKNKAYTELIVLLLAIYFILAKKYEKTINMMTINMMKLFHNKIVFKMAIIDILQLVLKCISQTYFPAYKWRLKS